MGRGGLTMDPGWSAVDEDGLMLGRGGAGELAMVRWGNDALDGEADGWSYAMADVVGI